MFIMIITINLCYYRPCWPRRRRSPCPCLGFWAASITCLTCLCSPNLMFCTLYNLATLLHTFMCVVFIQVAGLSNLRTVACSHSERPFEKRHLPGAGPTNFQIELLNTGRRLGGITCLTLLVYYGLMCFMCFFVLSRIAIVRYIIRHFWRKHVLDK